MDPFKKLESWSKKHHPAWIDALRIILGMILMYKGFSFLIYTSQFMDLLQQHFGIQSIMTALFITWMHLLTGFLLIIGLATRIACLVQIPIMLGAIFFVNSRVDQTSTGELILSILVLFLLMFFFVEGSGKFSAYYFVKNSIRSRIVSGKERPQHQATA